MPAKNKNNIENICDINDNNNGDIEQMPITTKLSAAAPPPTAVSVPENSVLTKKLLENVGQLNTPKKLQLAKAALHTSSPKSLPSREIEIEQIQEWIQQKLDNKLAGGMYVSGSPGTGKTAVVDHVLNNLTGSFHNVKINCMNIKNKPSLIFDEIVKQMPGKQIAATADDVLKRLTATNPRALMIIMVLDEVDQLLDSKLGSSTFLKTVYEWPRLPNSKLILIGIANALDMSTRHLPKYFTASNFQQQKSPKAKRGIKHLNNEDGGFLMHFTPYQKEDITRILEDRLNGYNVFDPAAIKFVANKVAATSGDIRKALNACKIALETIEVQGNQRKGLKLTADDGFNPGASPKKQQRLCEPTGPIGVLTLSKVLTGEKDDGTIPLQQGIILLTLHNINFKAQNCKTFTEDGIQTPIPIDRVYKDHLSICEKYMFPRIDRSDLPSACSMLQDRSLVTVIERSGSASPSASSPRSRFGTLKRGLASKSKSPVGVTGILFDPRAVEIALRNDPVLRTKLQ